MSLIRLVFGSVFALGFAAACSAATEAPTDPGDGEMPGTRVSVEAMKGGCKWVCPKCKPGQPCPLWPCHLECPNGGSACGNSVCSAGEYCCNESCGICAPEGGFCTEQFCEPTGGGCTVIALCIQGYEWNAKKCQCVPSPGGGNAECTTDADCHLEADYCTGCDCSALASNEQLPYCPGPGVKCFADPCMNHTAACVSGQCTTL